MLFYVIFTSNYSILKDIAAIIAEISYSHLSEYFKYRDKPRHFLPYNKLNTIFFEFLFRLLTTFKMQLFVRGNDVKQVDFDQTQSIAEFKVIKIYFLS